MKGFILHRALVGRGVLRRFALLSSLLLSLSFVASAQEREPEYDAHGDLESLESAHRQSEDSTKRAAGEDVSGREEWFRFQRRFPYDMIPAGARAAAIRQVQAETERLALAKRNGSSLLAASRWEQIGPYNWSGRTRSIAINQLDPRTIFIGVASGGVWRTTDAGTSWSTTFDTQSALSVCAVAIDPVNPRVIYAGTGENTSNIDAYLGDGIFKSTDNGESWVNAGLTSVGAISKIVVNPRDHDVVYVAAAKSGGGFYRTSDGGKTWDKTFTQSSTVFDMTVNPRNPNNVFIATNASVYRSDDGGKTFALSMEGMTVSKGVRLSIAISPTDTTRLYVLVARNAPSSSRHLADIYMSSDGGRSWTLTKALDESFFNEQGWYDHCIAVHPTRPGVVLIGGIDVYRSTDSGKTFNNVTFVYQGGVAHPDQHVLTFSPDPTTPDQVYLGNDGGLYISSNIGTKWTRLSNSLPTSQYYAMDVDQSRQYRVYGGTQDNGTHGSFDESKYAQSWDRVLQGDGFYVTVDMTDPNYIYAENYNGSPLYRINATSSSTLNQRVQLDLGELANDKGYWSTPIAMSPADKRTLYTGRTYLWRNSNPRTSQSWTKLIPDSNYVKNTSKKITAIGLSPLDAMKMMVGTNAGDLRYSTDGGANWKSSTGVPARFITQIRYDPVDQRTVYVTLSGFGAGHVFRSTDAGASFTNISRNLPDIPCSAVEIDPDNPGHVFVGTDAGVFVSMERDSYWLPFNDGLALAPVADLRIHRSSKSLIAATHGRSMFRVSIASPQPQPLLLSPSGGQTFTSPGALAIRWIGFTGRVRVLISYDGGATYDTVAADIAADSVVFTTPLIRTTRAVVKVEQIGGDQVVISGAFTLSPVANITDLGKKGVIAEALAVRGDALWATVRGTDTLVRFKLPLLTKRDTLVRRGIPGTVRDLDFDAKRGIFYALVADANGANPKVYRMDTNGVSASTVTLPTGSASGIAVVPSGATTALAIFSPGDNGTIYVINPEDGATIETHGPLQGLTGGIRRGLVWNGNGYIQGVNGRDLFAFFPGELHRITTNGPAEIAEVVPAVVSGGTALPVFFGLTMDPSATAPGERAYFATDTSGTILQFRAKIFSTTGVSSVPTSRASMGAAITGVMPNPVRTTATLTFELAARQGVTIDLYTPAGDLVAHVADASYEAGVRTVPVSVEGVPSGVYYITIETASGDRDVRPFVIVK